MYDTKWRVEDNYGDDGETSVGDDIHCCCIAMGFFKNGIFIGIDDCGWGCTWVDFKTGTYKYI